MQDNKNILRCMAYAAFLYFSVAGILEVYKGQDRKWVTYIHDNMRTCRLAGITVNKQ